MKMKRVQHARLAVSERRSLCEGSDFYEEARLVVCRISIVADNGHARKHKLKALVRRAVEMIVSHASVGLVCEIVAKLVRVLRE